MIREIQDIERSLLRPTIQDLPIPRWLGRPRVLMEDVYGGALEIHDLAEAESYLLELLSWRARVDFKRGLLRTYQQLIKAEREAIAWYALSLDVSLRPEYPHRIGEYPALDRVGRLFGAFLPESLGIRKRGLDIVAREIIEDAAITGQQISEQEAKAQSRRQRAAKKAGIVTPSRQNFLFDDVVN